MIIDSDQNKRKILKEFIKLSELDGVGDDTLNLAIKNILNKENICDLIFEDGCLGLINFYIDEKNNDFKKKLAKIEDFSSFKIRDKIKSALYLRFEIQKKDRYFMQQIFSYYIDPKNLCNLDSRSKPIVKLFKDCYKISDVIWQEIGDRSTDLNFYTKRLILSKIILRCLKTFLNDDGENLSKTKDLISGEINKVMIFEKYKSKFNKYIKGSFVNDDGSFKSPKDFVDQLPFFRLRKK